MQPFQELRQEAIFNEPSQAYRAAAGLNNSAIALLLDCPLRYYEGLSSPQVTTPAMRTGTLIHTLVLEPEQFTQRYSVLTEAVTTKAGKSQKAAALQSGIEPITLAEYTAAQAVADALYRTAPTATLLNLPGHSEVSLYWGHSIEGTPSLVQAKGRVDRLTQLGEEWLALDLKTTSGSCAPGEVSKHIAKYHYYRQAAWYLEGLAALGFTPCRFVFIFVSVSAPYISLCVTLPGPALELGRTECARGARIYNDCTASGVWPGYSEKIVEVDLPTWAYSQATNS